MRALFLVDPGFLTASFKMGVPREPGAADRVGKGGDSEHSRKNGKRIQRLPFLSRAEGAKKRGPRASPAQRVAWGEGGAAEYSRRNGSRQKRLPFLSRTELAPTWCGQQDSNLHGFPLEPKSSVSANSTMPAVWAIISRERGFVNRNRGGALEKR